MVPDHITSESIAPLRSEPSDRAEMVSCLLLGDFCSKIDSHADNWIKVRSHFDGYEGWTDPKLLTPLSDEDRKQEFSSVYVRTPFAPAVAKQYGYTRPVVLSLGMALPQNSEGKVSFSGFHLEFQRGCLFPKTKSSPENVVSVSRLYSGAPYLWGGKSLYGIDCSGLTQQVMRICGLPLPRDAWQQAEKGQVVPFEEKRPGDLAFFINSKGRVHHVGIVLPGGMIRHAHGRVRDDQLSSQGIINKDKQKISHELYQINRYF